MPSKKRKLIKTTGEPMEQPKVLSQEEIDAFHKTELNRLWTLLARYERRTDMSNIKVFVSESRPLEPVYPLEGGDHIGYIQRGPRKLVITVEDFEHDGHIRGTGEAW